MGLTDEQQQKLQALVDEDKDELHDEDLTSRVKLSLQRKYDYSGWALFFEIPGKNGRRADAIAYNMFPSRNFKALGFEVKVSRNDWKKELEDVQKADFFVGQCDEWYVVAETDGTQPSDLDALERHEQSIRSLERQIKGYHSTINKLREIVVFTTQNIDGVGPSIYRDEIYLDPTPELIERIIAACERDDARQLLQRIYDNPGDSLKRSREEVAEDLGHNNSDVIRTYAKAHLRKIADKMELPRPPELNDFQYAGERRVAEGIETTGGTKHSRE